VQNVVTCRQGVEEVSAALAGDAGEDRQAEAGSLIAAIEFDGDAIDTFTSISEAVLVAVDVNQIANADGVWKPKSMVRSTRRRFDCPPCCSKPVSPLSSVGALPGKRLMTREETPLTTGSPLLTPSSPTSSSPTRPSRMLMR
jgi:hypothetical protein